MNHKYRLKDYEDEVDAIQFRENTPQGRAEILHFMGESHICYCDNHGFFIDSPTGIDNLHVGDWLIRMKNGAFYTLTNEVFTNACEKVQK